jgi:hypothetical protein
LQLCNTQQERHTSEQRGERPTLLQSSSGSIMSVGSDMCPSSYSLTHTGCSSTGSGPPQQPVLPRCCFHLPPFSTTTQWHQYLVSLDSQTSLDVTLLSLLSPQPSNGSSLHSLNGQASLEVTLVSLTLPSPHPSNGSSLRTLICQASLSFQNGCFALPPSSTSSTIQ